MLGSVAAGAVLGGCATSSGAVRPAHIPAGYRLVYSQDFDQGGSVGDVLCSDPAAWRVNASGGRGYLELFQGSEYQPVHRSPHNIALFKVGTVEDFVLDLDMMQTGREYGHRDLCLFWGFEDTEHFYYVHIASVGDQKRTPGVHRQRCAAYADHDQPDRWG